jgi:pilus assembly protein Flp/PilA
MGHEPMSALRRFLACFLAEDDGPTAVEYAVMLALIIVVCLAAITIIGQKANQTFLKVGSALTASS